MPAGWSVPPVGVGTMIVHLLAPKNRSGEPTVAHHAAGLREHFDCFEWLSRPGPEAVDCEFGLASWIDVG